MSEQTGDVTRGDRCVCLCEHVETAVRRGKFAVPTGCICCWKEKGKFNLTNKQWVSVEVQFAPRFSSKWFELGGW